MNASLYIHVPFCERKCAYCSFYSIRKSDELVSLWLDGIAHEAHKYSGSRINTLYIGGGTPSILTLTDWEKLLSIINANYDLSCLTEATCEANPNSLTPGLLAFLKDNHFTRLSLGVQSLNDGELLTLGRIHNSQQAISAMEQVSQSGLDLSCDVIFGIPGQTLRTWSSTLKTIMRYANHISAYQLTLEPEAQMSEVYDNDALNNSGYKYYRYAQYYLPHKGYMQYEISSFARKGHECLHNISYWHQDNVIALGPASVSYIDGVRLSNPKSLCDWHSGAEPEREELSPHDRLIELAILSLRTKWGISRRKLQPELELVIFSLPAELFIITDERIALTQKGMRVGNAIWCEMLGV